MSHNITLKDVVFNDLGLLSQVIADLGKGRATLVNPATNFRTYHGQPTQCDAKIELPGPHDIGLKKGPKGFSPVFDPYNMTPVFRADGGRSMIGELSREYGLRKAEYEAAQNGMDTERVKGPRGVVSLKIKQSA